VLLGLLLACSGPAGPDPDPTGTSDTQGTTTTPTTPTEPTSRSLRVQVTLDGEPAAGVSVLQGGVPTRWTTDAAGEVTITVDFTVVGDTVVMASHPDARIEGDEVRTSTTEPMVIALRRFDRSDNPAYVFQDPGEGDPLKTSSAACLHCHISIHEAWWDSPHRTATSNPSVHDVYQGMAQALDAATCADVGGSWAPTSTPGSGTSADRCRVGPSVLEDTPGYGACADCHAPGIDGELGGRDLLDARGLAFDYGIHCDVCHKIESVDPTHAEPGLGGAITLIRPTEKPSSPVFGDWDPLTFGPWDDVVNPRMGSVHRELYHQAQYCAGCHQQEQPVLLEGASIDPVRWPGGRLPIHTTWAEWEASPFNPSAPCQSCHMPPDPDPASGADLYDGHDTGEDAAGIGVATGWPRPPGSVRIHGWYGPRQPESGMLALAGAVDVAPRMEDGVLVVEATARNVGPGHALPTGEPLRAVFLTVGASCDGVPLSPVDGPALPDWAGARESGTDPTRWVGAAVGDVVRAVRRSGGWVDYVGWGPFGDGRFTAAEKGVPEERVIGEVTVTSVGAGVATLSAALPPADVYHLVSGAVSAGAPGQAYARVTAGPDGTLNVPHFAAVDVVADTRLLPLSSRTDTWRFAATCSNPEATATLTHRNYPAALAAERGWTVVDQQMTTTRRTAP